MSPIGQKIRFLAVKSCRHVGTKRTFYVHIGEEVAASHALMRSGLEGWGSMLSEILRYVLGSGLLMLHVQVPIRLGCLAKARLSCHITFTSNIRFDMDARWTSGSFGTLVLTLAEVFRLALTANARPAPIRTPSLPLRSRES